MFLVTFLPPPMGQAAQVAAEQAAICIATTEMAFWIRRGLQVLTFLSTIWNIKKGKLHVGALAWYTSSPTFQTSKKWPVPCYDQVFSFSVGENWWKTIFPYTLQQWYCVILNSVFFGSQIGFYREPSSSKAIFLPAGMSFPGIYTSCPCSGKIYSS